MSETRRFLSRVEYYGKRLAITASLSSVVLTGCANIDTSAGLIGEKPAPENTIYVPVACPNTSANLANADYSASELTLDCTGDERPIVGSALQNKPKRFRGSLLRIVMRKAVEPSAVNLQPAKDNSVLLAVHQGHGVDKARFV